MSVVDFLFGKPLPSTQDSVERVGPASGIPIFGLDALGSAAYGPEAALTVLLPLGIIGVHHIVPIMGTIIVLLAIVFFSYWQTIGAYPGGGGSYTVAGENLGPFFGLLAASALMVDYVLVSAVGIAAGIGALVSAIPGLQPFTLLLCLISLTIITIVNLRGVRDTGAAFIAPTYLFIGCLLITVVLGAWKSFASGGHPVPVIPPPLPGPAVETAGIWIMLRAFSNGCTAMTGVEAISNGVQAFREPRIRSARMSLTLIILILTFLLAGIAYNCNIYDIAATRPGEAGYESVLSQLVAAVTGKGIFYYITIGSILIVLTLQANTAFADFPRLCRAIAQNGYLPRAFANRGRRLVYSHGILMLVFLTGFLLVMFEGVVDRLIPLFAIGAFMAFTLSQAGMVGHWKKKGGRYSLRSMYINGLGAMATASTVVVVIYSKFTEGAWITLILIPGLIFMMIRVRRHYERDVREIAGIPELIVHNLPRPLVVVPIEHWNRVAQKALHFAIMTSPEVIALHVSSEDDEGSLSREWNDHIVKPCVDAGIPVPRLVEIKSPYRYVIQPIIDFIFELERSHPDRQIAVIIPSLVERRWRQRFLHNQRGELLSNLLLAKGKRRIVIVNVPWYIDE